MNPNLYNIDYPELTKAATPAYIRKSRLQAFLQVLISGVVVLYQDMLRLRTQKLYELMITPQVCYLERLLNDRFDFTLRRIRVVDGIDKPPYYIYQQPELKPKYVRNRAEATPAQYIYTAGESSSVQDDFVVLVPLALAFGEEEMRSLVKAYKLAGTKFKIQRV